MGWPAIRGFEDGDKVVSEVLNLPLRQLAERTEYLRGLITRGGSARVVVTVDVPDEGEDGHPSVGQPVYRRPDGVYAQAWGLDENNAWFYASTSAMAVGVVSSVSGTRADIVLSGLIDFGETGPLASDVVADKTLRTGRHFLSAKQPGLLTSRPCGPVIYVCDCQFMTDDENNTRIASMLVNPQYRDTGESHVHRSFVVSGLPMGGAATVNSAKYYAPGILPTVNSSIVAPTAGTVQPDVKVELFGAWPSATEVTYTLTITRNTGAQANSASWSDYSLQWTSGEDDRSGSVALPALGVSNLLQTGLLSVGSHGLYVRLTLSSSLVTPGGQASKSWVIAMPTAAQAWMVHKTDGVEDGFRLNLGMYPDMADFVPPVPANGAALTVDGLERKGPVFGASKAWDILAADSEGGPWLVWFGNAVVQNSATVPFACTLNDALTTVNDVLTTVTTVTAVSARAIVLHVNRMNVGPDGFVTSLQVAEGSPLKITSAQTNAAAVQGALQIAMDVNFETSDSNVAGNEVVKRIRGTAFETGPVVERVIGGTGVVVTPEGGQGTVMVSVTNAAYGGDFETIALKNAKQDLAAGVFPYTKLLGYTTGGTGNVTSGFTAKFRVPDNIPYRSYRVIVSTSVFGEIGAASDAYAAFQLKNYFLADQACTAEAVDAFNGNIAAPTAGATAVIPVLLPSGYSAYDPVLIHGFPNLENPASGSQRQKIAALRLSSSENAPIVVKPGYFVGIEIERCGYSGTAGSEYVSPIGFLSLRWNLEPVS